jgi:hypothetical protein
MPELAGLSGKGPESWLPRRSAVTSTGSEPAPAEALSVTCTQTLENWRAAVSG